MAGGVTPVRADGVNSPRRAEDCPPYQIRPATGRWLHSQWQRAARTALKTRRAFRQLRDSWKIFDSSWKSSALPSIVGVFIVAAGALVATVRLFVRLAHKTGNYYSSVSPTTSARAILLGLEFLIAGDIIRTVVVAPTIQNVLVLGLIVLIRTFLSLSLQLEIEGRLPWCPTCTTPGSNQ